MKAPQGAKEINEKNMNVKDLFEKYCTKTEDGEYVVRGHCITLNPATAEELKGFQELCREYGVERDVVDELAEYFRQANSFFNDSPCNDRVLFEWWKGDDQRSIWLGNLDDESFIYDDISRKYAVGFAGGKELGEYDGVMEMLEEYLKEGHKNG